MNDSVNIVEVEELSKVYGDTPAVDKLSFTIAPGEIFGLIGSNGAGKTTTISILLGLVTATGGRIRIFGMDPVKHRAKVLSRMNFSSPYISLPYRLTVRENLTIYSDLYGMTDIEKRLKGLSRHIDISELLERRYGQLSSGEKTRVTMAKALLNDPDLLLLDEPTASLDPNVAEKVRGWLLSYKAEKKAAILISSHNMAEVERICDRVMILKQGRSIARGRPDELISFYGQKNLEALFIDLMREEKIT